MGGGYLSNLFPNKTKGFTLIELLAVIVVMAIIALIAVPIVLNIIKRAREGAAVSSARNYIKAVETYTVAGELDNSKTALKNNQKYNVTTSTIIGDKTYDAINDLVEIKGTKPSGVDDYVTLDDTSSVVDAKLTINDYEIIVKDSEIVSTTQSGKDEDNNNGGNNSNDKDEDTIIASGESLEIGKTLQLIENLDENQPIYSITWTSSDESIATVDKNGLVTGIKAGNVTITVQSSSGKKAGTDIAVGAKPLAEMVDIGDYVAYNVSPNSVSCEGYSTSLKGWRVLSKNGKTVTIIHAGQPECYYHDTDTSSSIRALNNLAQKYINNAYAESAHAMNYGEADAIAQSSDLRTIGTRYFLANAYDNSALWYMKESGSTYQWYSYEHSYGFRPVVILKPNIKTTGKVKDVVGQDAWSLIAP